MSRTKTIDTRGSSSLLSLLIGLVFIGTSAYVWLNRQYILDLVSFNQYTPTSEIERIAQRTTMNDTGTFYFYASKPSIEGAQTFNSSCQRKEESSAILGCYTNNRIFVYDVSNAQLDGIKEVTAAHEMLHAVYQRMSPTEKDRINTLLEAEYAKLQNDENLSERMAFYARTEAGERDNELHSILGTEVLELNSELEEHYAKYFTDRKSLATLYSKYAEVFDGLKAKADSLSSQLKELGETIESETAEYNQTVSQLNTDIQRFNSRASSGFYANRAEFDSARNALLARVNATSTSLAKINKDIVRYELLRKEYNDTASTSNELYKSIDSKLAPAPSV